MNLGGTGTVTATSNLGLTPVLSTSTLPVCTISGNIVAGVASGLCTIYATQGGNANAASAVADLSFSVGVGAPTLTFGAAPFITVGGTGTVSVTSDRNATPVSLTSTTPTCTLASGVVTGVSSGLCTIQAAQSAASSYTAASANLSFSIGAAALICNLYMDGVNPMLASKEGLILARAMLGFTGTAVTQGTGITMPWETIRDALNAKCGTAFP